MAGAVMVGAAAAWDKPLVTLPTYDAAAGAGAEEDAPMRQGLIGLLIFAGCSAAPPPEAQPGCNPIVGDDCLTPYPSCFHETVDSSTATGVRIKLAANEHVAYLSLTKSSEYAGLSDRSKLLAVYALTGFANFSSIGIQLGGIGALAPERRADLARLGMRALFVGFLATVINATVAGLIMG